MYEPADIYLDHAAATPKRPEVASLHARRCERFAANPHGAGRFATDCRRAVEKAEREILAELAIPDEDAFLIWTSGGTEAANLAILGGFPHQHAPGVAVSATAHSCLLEPAEQLLGSRLLRLPASPDGQVDYGAVEVDPRSALGLVGVCHVNNETGVHHDLRRLRRWMDAEAPRARLLVDALQSAGRIAIPWEEAGIDLLMLGGRKVGGPTNMGALIGRRGRVLSPLLFGGGQQNGLRPGTVDVVGALELAQALRMAVEEREEARRRADDLNRLLRNGLCQIGERFSCRVISPAEASPWILCAVFDGYEGAILTRLLGGRSVAVSAGSACSADSDETSHVLHAMRVPDSEARGMVRISMGWETARSDIQRFLEELETVLKEY